MTVVLTSLVPTTQLWDGTCPVGSGVSHRVGVHSCHDSNSLGSNWVSTLVDSDHIAKTTIKGLGVSTSVFSCYGPKVVFPLVLPIAHLLDVTNDVWKIYIEDLIFVTIVTSTNLALID